MDWVDRVWVGMAWLVGTLAVAAFAWGLLGDWFAGRGEMAVEGGGRRRCRRCKYDMRMIAGTTCPECGRANTARDLARSRISKRLAVVGILLAAPAWIAGRVPEARREGWERLMPSAVYAAVAPLDDTDWRARWLRPLETEISADRFGPLARRITAARLVAAMRHEHPDWKVEVFDVTNPEFPAWETAYQPVVVTCFGNGRDRRQWDGQHEYSRDMHHLIESMIEPDLWKNNGGDSGRMHEVADRLVIGAPPHVMARVGRLVAAVQDRAHIPHLSEEDGILRVRCEKLLARDFDDLLHEEAMRDLRNTITHTILADGWTDNGGDEALTWCFRDILLVQAAPPFRDRVAQFLQAVDRAANQAEPTRLPAARLAGPYPDFEQPDEYTAIWPLGELRDIWNGMDEEAWARWAYQHDLHRKDTWDIRGQADVSGPRIPTKVSLMALGCRHWLLKHPETSDERVKILVFGRVLIATAPEPSTLDAIDAARRELLADLHGCAFGDPCTGESSVPALD